MKNKIVSNQPQKVATYPEITPSDQDAVECVNEIFKSLVSMNGIPVILFNSPTSYEKSMFELMKCM